MYPVVSVIHGPLLRAAAAATAALKRRELIRHIAAANPSILIDHILRLLKGAVSAD